jgi:hypothetical protein
MFSDGEPVNCKDELFNDVVDLLAKENIKFASPTTEGSYFVTRWYYIKCIFFSILPTAV